MINYGTFQKANNKGADQTARMRRLVCACVVRKPPKTGFLASRPIYFYMFPALNLKVFVECTVIENVINFKLFFCFCSQIKFMVSGLDCQNIKQGRP